MNVGVCSALILLSGAGAQGTVSFSTRPGFNVERVYDVPRDQGSWVALARDDRGRLYASDQGDKGLYRVTLPGEGRTVRVERIEVDLPGGAQGLLWAFDSLYAVVNRKGHSGLYRLRDTDGDDRLDQVTLLRRFVGDGEHGPHAVVLGPDGRALYLVAGNQTRLPDPERSLVPRAWAEDMLIPRVGPTDGTFRQDLPGGWVCRTDPDGQAFELVAMGFRNPYDLAFDAGGVLFTFDSDMEWDLGTPWYRPTRVCHVPSGADFGYREGSSKWPADYPDSLPAVHDVGTSSPTGIAFGYGAKFPKEYQHALFLADWSYGKIYAARLTPEGPSYRGEVEVFLAGAPLPVTDLLIHPDDGALYFTVGGRGAASALYRVVYRGDESTGPTPAAPPPTDVDDARAALRRLEAFHGRRDPGAVDAAWPFLGHRDPFLRNAARVAIEHQPVDSWRARALEESSPRAAIQALIALARLGESNDRDRIFESLNRIDLAMLAEGDRLDLLRAYTLAVARQGVPESAERSRVLERLDGLSPTGVFRLDRELCRLLVVLGAPGVVERTLAILERADYPNEVLDFANALRMAERGLWSGDQRRRYFAWINHAAVSPGGVSLREYLEALRDDALRRCPEPDRDALADVVADFPPVVDPLETLRARPVVRAWSVDDLLAKVEAGSENRDPERGRRLYAEALCVRCHRFDGRGGMTGPDLTGVGRRYDARTLLESLIEPSKVVSDQYAPIRVATRDGRVVVGRIGDITDKDELVLKPDLIDEARVVRIKRSEIEEMALAEESPMPAGLLDTFTEAEVLDLIAYLRSGGATSMRAALGR
jgi:putative heme-binding domain-containing protein